MVAFVVSCCMMLFVRTLADTMGLVFTKDNIAAAAKLTFGNVLLITFLSGTFDYFRRKQMVERPVKQIMAALDQVMQGDFSVRIEPVKEFAGETGFNEIIAAINKMTAELQGTETTQIIVGDGAKLCYDALTAAGIPAKLAPPNLRMQSAWGVARLALEKARKGQTITANELAQRAGTIPYEILCAISPRVPRVYVD